MAGYLLAANTLIDMCIEKTAAFTWLATNNIPLDDIFISVISLSAARRAIAAAPHLNDPSKGRLLHALDVRVGAMKSGGAVILPFTEREARVWENWIDHAPLDCDDNGTHFPASQDVRMVVATAVQHGCTLVEPKEPYHTELVNNQVAVHSL